MLRLPAAHEKLDGEPFGGAWLESPNGERWVIDYDPESIFRELPDLPVTIVGRRNPDEWRLIREPDIEIDELRCTAAAARFTWIGPEQDVDGTFTYPPTAESGGLPNFVSVAKKRWEVVHTPASDVTDACWVTLRMREVQAPNTDGGDYAWGVWIPQAAFCSHSDAPALLDAGAPEPPRQ